MRVAELRGSDFMKPRYWLTVAWNRFGSSMYNLLLEKGIDPDAPLHGGKPTGRDETHIPGRARGEAE